jgi:hypothetical protein
MKVARILKAITGIIQEGIGMLTAILALLLFLSIVDVEEVFRLPSELLPFYLLILGLFSIFSIASGLFLIREEQG